MIFEKAKTKKNALSVASGILSAALVAGIIPGSALLRAAQAEVAQIGDTQYQSLADAIASAKADDTIKLIADGSSEGLANINKSISIDLNGFTYTDTDKDYPFAVTEGATVTLKDSSEGASGKFVHSGNSGIYAFYGNFVLESGTIETDANKAVSVNDGNLVIKGGVINENSEDGYALYAYNKYAPSIKIEGGDITSKGYGLALADSAAVVDIEGGSITAEKFAVATNGSVEKAATVNIKGGSLKSSTIAVYQPSGDFTLTGGELTGATAYYIKSGSLNLSAGKLTANGEKADYVASKSGASATGEALVIDNCGYPWGEPKVTISGGTFSSANADAVGSYASDDLTAVSKFTKGGTYSNAIPESFLADGYSSVDNGDGTFRASNVTEDKSFGAFVERLYTVALNRPSEEEGKKFWVDNVENGTYAGAYCATFFLTGDEFLSRDLSDDEFITTLYKTFFDRDPDEGGFKFWKQFLADGYTRSDVVIRFADSPEWCNICAQYGVKSGAITAKATIPSEDALGFAKRLYTKCLGRDAEEGGLNFWALGLTNLEYTGANAALQFFFSDEYVAKNKSNEEFVTDLYRTFMDREPEADGAKFWADQLTAGMSRIDVLRGFAMSDEFTALCKGYAIERGTI